MQVWTVASLVSIPHMEMQHMEMQVEMQVEVFRKPDGIKFSKSRKSKERWRTVGSVTRFPE